MIISEGQGYKTVSYTHLDVYKRQGRVFAQACLTERPTSRSETKVGESDPAPTRGSGVAQRIKVTLGITG